MAEISASRLFSSSPPLPLPFPLPFPLPLPLPGWDGVGTAGLGAGSVVVGSGSVVGGCAVGVGASLGLDRLLDAVALLAGRRPGMKASLVGDGVLRGELEARAARLGLSGRVRFEGARPFEEIASWLRRARLMVMTSEMEGLPQAMIEAMSCGVPVVVK